MSCSSLLCSKCGSFPIFPKFTVVEALSCRRHDLKARSVKKPQRFSITVITYGSWLRARPCVERVRFGPPSWLRWAWKQHSGAVTGRFVDIERSPACRSVLASFTGELHLPVVVLQLIPVPAYGNYARVGHSDGCAGTFVGRQAGYKTGPLEHELSGVERDDSKSDTEVFRNEV